MSAIELIFENKVILISLLAVVVPQVVALFLVLGIGIVRLVKYLAEQKKQKREHLRQMAAQAKNDMLDVDMSALGDLGAKGEAGLGGGADRTPPGMGTGEDADEESEAASNEEVSEEESTGFDLNSESDMQSLLADVFVDDTMDQKAEMLLGEIEPMNVDMLLEFAEAINQRLPDAVGE